ncbi:HYR domain-containing protein, partial [Flavilitoribacter nigricans]
MILAEKSWGNGKVMFGGLTLPWFQEYWSPQPYVRNLHNNILEYLYNSANVVIDETAPVLSGVPNSTNVECDNVPNIPTVTANDDVDGNLPVTFSETRVNGSCAFNYTLIRTWSATDAAGNEASASQTITVYDDKSPVIDNLPVQLTSFVDAGSCGAIVSFPTITATDNCGNPSFEYSPLSGSFFNVGQTTVTVITTDDCGNSRTENFLVVVEDNIAPETVCQDLTVSLDAAGNASITPAQIDNGSSDACGIAELALDRLSFGCADVGSNPVVLTVTDNNDNSATCSATVTVEDKIVPQTVCQDITVSLDAAGNASITPAQIDNGSSDACGIAELALDRLSFGCADVGNNTVVLTVTDNNDNSATCSATVTVEDKIVPQTVCQDITVSLDAAGNASITPAQIDNGSSDACGIAELALDRLSFGCADVGSNPVVLTVTDNNDNSASCSATVTVEDKIVPQTVCQDLTVSLDASGNASITPAQIDNGSSDACGIAELALDRLSFGCADVGSNPVVLT